MPSSTRHRRWPWQGCLSAGFLFSLISAAAAQDGGASPAKKAPGRSVEARIEHGLLTLHANGAPLAEVLRAIGRAGGFEVVLRGGFATPVQESFTEFPAQLGWRSIRTIDTPLPPCRLRCGPRPLASRSGFASINRQQWVDAPITSW